MKNSTVTLLLDQLRRESQKQKEDGDLKDGEYQEITELIGQIERAFTNGSVRRNYLMGNDSLNVVPFPGSLK